MARQRLTPPPGSEELFSGEALLSREEVLAAAVQQLGQPEARAAYTSAVAAGETQVDVPLNKLAGTLMLLQVRMPFVSSPGAAHCLCSS
jgi:hypothetical protein